MPSREDERWRNILPHLPTCSCPTCTKSRLLKLERERYHGTIECPVCKYISVVYDGRRGQYICLNPGCGVMGQTLSELSNQVMLTKLL